MCHLVHGLPLMRSFGSCWLVRRGSPKMFVPSGVEAHFGSKTTVPVVSGPAGQRNGSLDLAPVTISTVASVFVQPVVTPTNAQSAPPSVTQPVIAEVLAPAGLQLAQTPILLSKMRPFLQSYPNRHDAQVLFQGFSVGFRLGYTGPRTASAARNLVSVRGNLPIVRQKIDRELQLGRVAGPFSTPPLPNLRCSPVGLVPKQAPGEFRLIHNLSSPLGNSVNDHIDPSAASVHYASFDDAVAMVTSLGPEALMAKADIKSAFRLLPVHPIDFDLLGFTIEGLYYFDKCMPMGCSISCATFERFSTFLEYSARKVSASQCIMHYLDDFLFAGKQNTQECLRVMQSFRVVAKEFGVPLAEEKSEGPTTKLSFLGLDIDTVAQEIQVPPGKIVALQAKLSNVISKKKVTLRELQSVLGSLNFVCKAVRPGRAFLRRLFDLTRGVSIPHHRIRISSGAREDLLAWQQFLSRFNGTVVFPSAVWSSSSSLHLFTDASAELGFGAFFDGSWSQGRWPCSIKASKLSIAFLELFPVTLALRLWGQHLQGKRVIFWCDNEAVVAIINRQTSHCAKIMKLVRFLVLRCLELDIHFKARHVPGVDNSIADALSRFQMDRFRRLAPGADPVMTPLPGNLWSAFS